MATQQKEKSNTTFWH